MAHQVIWTKIILEEFIELASLDKTEEMIMRTRAAGWTRTEQAMKLNISLATVDRCIKRLKIKYDEVQQYSVLLPPRKESADELYMDRN